MKQAQTILFVAALLVTPFGASAEAPSATEEPADTKAATPKATDEKAADTEAANPKATDDASADREDVTDVTATQAADAPTVETEDNVPPGQEPDNAPGPGQAPPTEDRPPASRSSFAAANPAIGVAAGLVLVPGRLSRELDPGFLVTVLGQADLPFASFLRGELSLGVSRHGRTVPAAVGSLWRTPLILSVLAVAPMEDWFGDNRNLYPTPYLRIGGGASTAFFGRGIETRWSEGSVDPVAQWGIGFEYPLSKFFELDRMVTRIEFAHAMQFEDITGHFLTLTFGVLHRCVVDQDGDGITDDRDQCPTEPEDPDAFADDDGCPDPDNDGDGLLDDNDACPDTAEDLDNFEDQDGCPDLDNDKDQVADADDKCPLEAEDRDGFEDEDGCPELDNDNDTIPDARDQCIMQAEDFDGFEDTDGCPDPDNKDDKADRDTDQDGVPDAVDACPLEAEDKDNFEDTDGCPDLDNDGDGIGDAYDQCPNQEETVNGVDDGDGCPDQGAQLVRLTKEKIEIEEKVYFDTNSNVIQARSHGLLDQVATVIQNHAEIRLIRIEGHTDDTGAEDYNQRLSQRRAEAVRDYLLEKGVDGHRLEAVGFGETRPVASNKSTAGREMNRRVEFIVVPDDEIKK